MAELRTRRHGTLVTRNGASAEVTVDEVAVMDALRVEATFVEVEVELTAGDPRKLGAIVKKLAAAGAQPSDGTPKVFRALGIARPSAEGPEEPIEALRALLRTQVSEILGHDPGTRLGRDPESLHDMRVATRRLRALLRAGAGLFTNDVEALTAELKWLGEVLGAVRDLDVLLDRLRGEAATLGADDTAAATRLLAALERRRSRARRSLLKALGGERYLRLVDHLDETIDALVPAESDLTLSQLAATQLRKVRRAARGLGTDAPDAALHELRKRAKRLRYAHELSGDDAVVKRAKALQDVLGEHQDAVVAEASLRELAAGAEPAEAIAAGLLIARERERRAQARDAWPSVWRKLVRAAG